MVRRIRPGMRAELEEEQACTKASGVPRLYVSCDGTGVPMRRSELLSTAAVLTLTGTKETPHDTKRNQNLLCTPIFFNVQLYNCAECSNFAVSFHVLNINLISFSLEYPEKFSNQKK